MNARAPKLSKLSLTQNDFLEISELFVRLTGNKMGLDKKALVEARLQKSLLESNLNPRQYLDRVREDALARSRFITLLTTHKTDWFREPLHFEFLKSDIQARLSKNGLKFWSAACSTGEEVYTLVMVLDTIGLDDFKILGSDISAECVEKARVGIFQQRQVEDQVPVHYLSKYFLRGAGEYKGRYRFSPAFEAMLKFREYDLLTSNLSSDIKFDYIFLRNVLIYFDSATIELVARKLMHRLVEDGVLIVGLSEGLPRIEGLQRIATSVYRKCR